MTNQELFSKHLSFVGVSVSFAEAEMVYHEDATMEFPYAPVGHTRKLDGRDAILGFLARIATFTTGFKISEPTYFESPNGFVANYLGSSTFSDTGLPYEQEYLARVTVRDGRISNIREFYDPLRVLRAMGEIE